MEPTTSAITKVHDEQRVAVSPPTARLVSSTLSLTIRFQQIAGSRDSKGPWCALTHIYFDENIMRLFGLGGADLARLEIAAPNHFATKRDFVDGDGVQFVSLAERTAQLTLLSRHDCWRVGPRFGDSAKCQLHVLDKLLWPASTLAAGLEHTAIVNEAGLQIFGFKLSALGAANCVNFPGGQFNCGGTAGTRHDTVQVLSVAAGNDGTLAVTSDGAVQRVAFPPSYNLSRARKVVLVSAGEAHAACVTAAGDLFTWGDGSYGQLGRRVNIGAGRARQYPNMEQVRYAANWKNELESAERVEFAGQSRIVGVSCGSRVTAAVTLEGRVLLCGRLTRRAGASAIQAVALAGQRFIEPRFHSSWNCDPFFVEIPNNGTGQMFVYWLPTDLGAI